MNEKIIKTIKNPSILLNHILMLGWSKCIPDDIYLKMKYRILMKKKLDIKNPQTFNEKLQWLKLYDRNPLYTTMVDKYEAKKYVADTIGEEYIIPTLGIWDKFDDIDFDSLPNQFVLKCTHDSGGVVICKDKSMLDLKMARKKINKSLRINYYYLHREWPYNNVKPRIIAEKYMKNPQTKDLNDYKLMMFYGELTCSFVVSNRYSGSGLNVTFYDKEWDIMPFERHYSIDKCGIEKPVSYQKMIQLAEKLSKYIHFVRVDFYEIQGKPYFSELTFYPGSGFEEFTPEEWDYKLGEMIKLPNIKSDIKKD